MKFMNIIKKQKTLIVLTVVMIAVAALGVSYAIFFDVKASNVQKITAGSLTLTLNTSTLTPTTAMNATDGLNSTASNYTIKNTGNLPATYSLYAYADTGNAITLDKVNISLNGSNSYKKINAYITGQFSESGVTYYKIASGTLAATTGSTTGSIKIWVDEASVGELNNAKLNIGLYLVSEVNES